MVICTWNARVWSRANASEIECNWRTRSQKSCTHWATVTEGGTAYFSHVAGTIPNNIILKHSRFKGNHLITLVQIGAQRPMVVGLLLLVPANQHQVLQVLANFGQQSRPGVDFAFEKSIQRMAHVVHSAAQHGQTLKMRNLSRYRSNR